MKAFLKTYGCRANQYDTEAVRAMLAAAGIEEAANPADADVAVFNTCTVTAAAEADFRSDVRNASRLNPGLRAVVMGCAAAVPNRDESIAPLSTLPGVSSVVPGADIAGIAAALGLDRPTIAAKTQVQSGARALLRIQDGCDEHCTFCATTISRGANRSRSSSQILSEAAALAETHPEIVLTGIHIGTYGVDLGGSLSALVEMLIREVPRVRFRLTSVEATEVDDRLAELLVGDSSRLAPHLHAPLQSGSDAVLRRMGRHWYTAGSYAAAVERIFGNATRFALAADVITGFPGETEADHMATMSLVEQLPFTSLHVFPWSPRPGTAALRLRDRVNGTAARRRAAELRVLANAKGEAHARARVGGACDVVVTERGKGLTEDYLSVAVSDSSAPRRARFDGILQSGSGCLTAIPTSVMHV